MLTRSLRLLLMLSSVVCAGAYRSAIARAQAFSADLVATKVGGQANGQPGRLYVSRDKVRIQTPESADNFFIVDGRIRLVDLPGYGFAKAGKGETKRFQNLGRAYLRGRSVLKFAREMKTAQWDNLVFKVGDQMYRLDMSQAFPGLRLEEMIVAMDKSKTIHDLIRELNLKPV